MPRRRRHFTRKHRRQRGPLQTMLGKGKGSPKTYEKLGKHVLPKEFRVQFPLSIAKQFGPFTHIGTVRSKWGRLGVILKTHRRIS